MPKLMNNVEFNGNLTVEYIEYCLARINAKDLPSL